jgi:hypothetical protein
MCIIIHTFCPKCDSLQRSGIVDCEIAKTGEACGNVRVQQDHFDDNMCDKCYKKSKKETLKGRAKYYAKKVSGGSSSKVRNGQYFIFSEIGRSTWR